MNQLFVRLFVAFAAFSFSLVLTNFLRPAVDNRKVVTVVLRPQSPIVGSTEAESEILEIYRQYGPAQTRHDRKFFERIETEDFTLTVGCTKMSREEDIRWMEEQPTDRIYESTVDHLKVFDDLALAHGRLQIRHRNGVIQEWPFADVWIRRAGVWRIQSTTSQ